MLNLPTDAELAARGRPRLVLLLGLCTMEMAWVWAWVLAFPLKSGAPILAAPLLWVVVVGGAALTDRLRGRPANAGPALLAALVPVALVVLWAQRYHAWAPYDPGWVGRLLNDLATNVPEVWLTLICVAFLWWRGCQAALTHLTSSYLASRGVRGAGLILSAVVVAMLGGRAGGASSAQGAAFLLFTVTALLCLPVAQLAEVRNESRWRGATPPPLDRRWGAVTGAGVVLVLAAGLLVAAVASPQWLQPLAVLFGWLGDLLNGLLAVVLWLLGGPLTFLLGLIPFGKLRQHPQQPPAGRPKQHDARQALHHQAAAHPPTVLLTVALLAVLVVICALLLRRALHISAESGAVGGDAEEEERISVWSWEGLRPDLSKLRARLRFKSVSRHLRLQGGPPESTADAYRALLRLGAERGRPRLRQETPAEYLARLEPQPVLRVDAATTLTGEYARVLYGQEPEDLSRVRAAWQRLVAPAEREPGSDA